MKETFGQRFARLRKARKLTQEDIATKLYISPQAVSKWENDISSPDISMLSQIAEILGVSVDVLLGKDPEEVVKINPEVKEGDEPKKVDLSKLICRLKVISSEGDVVKLNIPLQMLKMFKNFDSIHIEGGSASDLLSQIDADQVISMAENGMLGNLINVQSKEGDIVKIYVCRIDQPDDEVIFHKGFITAKKFGKPAAEDAKIKINNRESDEEDEDGNEVVITTQDSRETSSLSAEIESKIDTLQEEVDSLAEELADCENPQDIALKIKRDNEVIAKLKKLSARVDNDEKACGSLKDELKSRASKLSSDEDVSSVTELAGKLKEANKKLEEDKDEYEDILGE